MSIRLSPKHGVNPSVCACYLCGEDKNMLVLRGQMPGDAQAPHRAVWDAKPCDKCKGYMQQGVILISIRDGEDDVMDQAQRDHEDAQRHKPANKRKRFVPNPYRTGGWCVVKEDVIKRMCIQLAELEEQILRARMCFLPDKVWDLFGLPRGPVNEESHDSSAC